MELTKKALRVALKSKRDSLGQEVRNEYSMRICDFLMQSELIRDAKTIAGYYPIGSEVDIYPFLVWLLPGKRTLLLPKIIDDALRLCSIKDFDELTAGAYGTSEPSNSKSCDTPPDVILVPGLAFSRDGHRVGYGKGYYDRFLKGSEAHFVGVGYEFQLVDSVPHDKHDVSLHAMIHENGYVDFREKS